MNIRKIQENKVKITFSEDDMEKIGITFEELDSDEITARIFIGSLLKLLDEVGIFRVKGGNIKVDITKKENKDIIIFFSAENTLPENTWAAYVFSQSGELTDFCRNVLVDFSEYINNDLLFTFENYYILLINFSLGIKKIHRIKHLEKNAVTDLVSIGKIKEYAELISRTPLEKIFDLP